MLTTINGYYEHGHIILQELQPAEIKSTEVIITFLTEKKAEKIYNACPAV